MTELASHHSRVHPIVQNVIGGLVALALIVYLFVALIRPEKF